MTYLLSLALALSASVTQAPVQKVLEDDLLPPQSVFLGHHSGASLDMNEQVLAVGFPYELLHNIGFGKVELYRYGAGGWALERVIEPQVLQDRYFGAAVALEGDLLAVGAPYTDRSTQHPGVGVVYLYQEVNGSWDRVEVIQTPSAVGFGYGFGSDVDLEGELMAVGAEDSGRCFVFESSSTGYLEIAELAAPAADMSERFGGRVALAGDQLFVSAPGGGAGRVYVYRRMGADYVLESTLESADGAVGDRFGEDIHVEADRLIVGAPGWGSQAGRPERTGAVYSFEQAGSSWTEVDRLDAPPGLLAQEFGHALGRSGQRLLVGAPATPALSVSFRDAGAVHLYEESGSTWAPLQRYEPKTSVTGDRFGQALAFHGARGAIGAPDHDGAFVDSGMTYTIWPFATSYGRCVAPLTCGNHFLSGGCVNSTGAGASLRARGDTSVANDNLTLIVRDLPPQTVSLLFMGAGALDSPFVGLYGGLRCVGPGSRGMFRFPVRLSDASGSLVEGPGIGAWTQALPPAGQFMAGDTWYFQCFYRDVPSVAGSCGTGANLTDALRIQLIP